LAVLHRHVEVDADQYPLALDAFGIDRLEIAHSFFFLITKTSTSPSRAVETSSWPVWRQYAGKSCSAALSVARTVSSPPGSSSRILRLARSTGSGQARPVASYSRRSVTGRSAVRVIVLHRFGHPSLDVGKAGLVGRMGAEPLRCRAAAAAGAHAFPEMDRLVRVVAGERHQD